ncbi:hypothetical protein MT340_000950 [Staphylococcus sp. NRL 16/872]|uniref:hypothetical protein n=1 Tax=Staphylococcus sp. NRL 16/872 TaxID=2930131 RepID=UPI001FB4B2CD|nr:MULTISPECIES: hypothetical protein [unclassified Staphylococcus]MCJ1655343.1 hypothetical protein [Staphylococcus sp. NRL 21/187]MCJ1661181.1 hypothetical protein [Staphylococcus sp. NRL 18/288]MCJ1667071.1 hypothetical protein [Staphylococcus sp. NRL 19/737]WEN69547.1 hypothetical protein MT340_000950 [Staphylococcus sp. NRL 16/872]
MLKKQDEMEQHHFNVAAKWTNLYFFIALLVYNLYIKITTGTFNVVWLIMLVGLVIYWGIATYLKYSTRIKN